MNSSVIEITHEVSSQTPNIPAFVPYPQYPNNNWHDKTGVQFVEMINRIYENVIQWKKNLFKLPSGAAGKSFISELTLWLDHFNRGTELRSIALKVFMILPSIMLQKPSRNSKAKDHAKRLDERINLWHEGKVDDIMKECSRIQKNLISSIPKNRTPEDSARSFAKLVWNGRVSAALKMLTTDYDNGVLTVDDKVYVELHSKHPKQAKIHEDALLEGPIDNIPSNYFDSIDEIMISN